MSLDASIDLKQLFNIRGKVAIITGASSGLGKVISLGLAKVGVKVVLASRNISLLKEIKNEVEASGGHALAFQTDVTHIKDIDAMVQSSLKRFQRLDILINNAGITLSSAALDLDIGDWKKVIDTNLTSALACSQFVAKVMKENGGGRIINISSVLGNMVTTYNAAYCVSKAGLNHLTRVLALEWARYNILVNAIMSGFFITELTRERLNDPQTGPVLLAKIPLKRFAKPEELVGLVIFLCSSASDYITGESIVLDGGYSLT